MAAIPDDWVTLKLDNAVDWTYPIAHGTTTYIPFRGDVTDPGSPWFVAVPRDAAEPFLKRGGFTLAETAMVLRTSGYAKLYHPDGPRSCGWKGLAFTSDERGVIEVPAEAVGELQSHGFLPAPPEMLVVEEPKPKAVPDTKRRVPRT